jgi:hypothetical protein
MTDTVDYQQAWQQYRQRGRLWIALFILYVPVVVGTAMFCLKYFHTPKPAIVVALLWMGLTLYLGARITVWRCPRCGNPFSGTLWRSKGLFTRQCAHCGLLKYGKNEESSVS